MSHLPCQLLTSHYPLLLTSISRPSSLFLVTISLPFLGKEFSVTVKDAFSFEIPADTSICEPHTVTLHCHSSLSLFTVHSSISTLHCHSSLSLFTVTVTLHCHSSLSTLHCHSSLSLFTVTLHCHSSLSLFTVLSSLSLFTVTFHCPLFTVHSSLSAQHILSPSYSFLLSSIRLQCIAGLDDICCSC